MSNIVYVNIYCYLHSAVISNRFNRHLKTKLSSKIVIKMTVNQAYLIAARGPNVAF